MNEEQMSNMSGMGLTGPDRMSLEEQQAETMQSAQDNPFNAPQYQEASVPDSPIQYGGGMAEILLSDNEVPEPIKRKYWHVFNKDNVLTFLDEKRKSDKMLAFDLSVIDHMNSMESYFDYDFEQEAQYNLVRNALDVKLDRAVGAKGNNIKNERVVLQSQFSEQRAINEVGNQGNVKEGFFKRLLGRRG